MAAWTLAGDTARVQSAASFVVLDPSAPPATILYQNFPNPFPNARVSATCVWFDLHDRLNVRIDVLDLRGNDVRFADPGASFPGAGELPPGRYGRASEGSDSGCDPRLSWDGRDKTGRTVPPGVYLIRLRAAGMGVVPEGCCSRGSVGDGRGTIVGGRASPGDARGVRRAPPRRQPLALASIGNLPHTVAVRCYLTPQPDYVSQGSAMAE